jgi:hypothetical protein
MTTMLLVYYVLRYTSIKHMYNIWMTNIDQSRQIAAAILENQNIALIKNLCSEAWFCLLFHQHYWINLSCLLFASQYNCNKHLLLNANGRSKVNSMFDMIYCVHNHDLYTPAPQQSCRGVYWFHPVRPSVDKSYGVR